ncbi:MAG TPA: AraC family transcriptional regulator [Ohtaekwangia sp.]|nr:AraC family transcriptional regulator [Ohtaekwangia sp.]
MIISRKHFDLRGKCIIENLSIKNPGRIAVEFHNEACYIFLRQGNAIIKGSDSSTQLISKDGIALNCGNYFADFGNVQTGISTEIFAIHLYPALLQEIFRNEIPSFVRTDTNFSLPVKTVSDSVMDRFIESLVFYFDNSHIVTDDILILKIKELILLLIQSSHAKTVHELISALFTRKSVTVSDVVNAHIFDNLSIDELAELSGLSVTSFKTEFSKIYKEPPGHYIRRRKIERAKELLRISNDSISQIADQLGYSDISHFSKSFQAQCGESPSVYRKAQGL